MIIKLLYGKYPATAFYANYFWANRNPDKLSKLEGTCIKLAGDVVISEITRSL
jgi:hypothetical protein